MDNLTFEHLQNDSILPKEKRNRFEVVKTDKNKYIIQTYNLKVIKLQERDSSKNSCECIFELYLTCREWVYDDTKGTKFLDNCTQNSPFYLKWEDFDFKFLDELKLLPCNKVSFTNKEVAITVDNKFKEIQACLSNEDFLLNFCELKFKQQCIVTYDMKENDMVNLLENFHNDFIQVENIGYFFNEGKQPTIIFSDTSEEKSHFIKF